jgi:multiple sugar transport system ATP-binding protein
VAVLKDGLLQQCATPRELYDRPVNTFVAGFIGSPGMNLFTAPLTIDGARLDQLTVSLSRAAHAAAGDVGEVRLGVRPEAFRLVGADEPGLQMTVRLVEEQGADAFVHGELADRDTPTKVIVRTEGAGGYAEAPAFGDTVRVALRHPDRVHAFHPGTGERLPA